MALRPAFATSSARAAFRNILESFPIAAAVPETGIVDQHVDFKAVFQRKVEHIQRSIRPREIACANVNGDPLRLQFIFQLKQLALIPRNNHQIIFLPGQQPGEFQSQAAGCAGNQGSFSFSPHTYSSITWG